MLVRARELFTEGTSLCSQLQKLDKEEDAVLKKYQTKRKVALTTAIVSGVAILALSPQALAKFGVPPHGRLASDLVACGLVSMLCCVGGILTFAFLQSYGPNKFLFKKDLVRVARKIQSIDVMLGQQSGITARERTQMSEAKEMFSTKLERMKAKYSGGLNITREALERQLTAKLLKDRSEGVQVQQVLPV